MRKIKPTKFDAISELVTGAFGSDDNAEEVTYLEGQTPPSEEEIDAKFKELTDDWTAKEYARNRALDYPDWRDHLNKIYDDGIDKWKTEMVDPVKAKWPKDNSGPK